jgi:uncharacterized protein YcfL
MFRHHRALLALTLALVLFGGVSATFAQEAAAQTPPKAVWINPIRGVADIQYTKPVIKRDKDVIVTTITVKNVSTGPIARLTIEEFWYDGGGNPVTGDKQFVRQPLMPGETATLVLKTPVKENMKSNQLKFSHQNGTIKPKIVPKLDAAVTK